MEIIKKKVADVISPLLYSKVVNLEEEQRLEFEAQFIAKKKSCVVAFLLSLFSCHRFYYGQVGLGLLFLVLMCFGVGIFWLVYDWFTMSRVVREINNETAIDIYRRVSL